jgi:tetratricopeptide (TPR) repeat protein
LAEQQDDINLQDKTAAQLLIALQLILFELLPSDDQSRPHSIRQEIKRLASRYSEGEIGVHMSAEDFYRLGNAAGRTNQFDAAAGFYSGAIAKDPKHEDAYTYRALARDRLGDAIGTVEDATEALRLNEADYDRVHASLNQAENQSVFRRSEVRNKLSHLLSRRVQTFQIRAQAFKALGQLDRAMADANECVRLQSLIS